MGKNQSILHSSGKLDVRASCRHWQNKINVEENNRWIKENRKEKNPTGYIYFKWDFFWDPFGPQTQRNTLKTFWFIPKAE